MKNQTIFCWKPAVLVGTNTEYQAIRDVLQVIVLRGARNKRDKLWAIRPSDRSFGKTSG